MIHGINNESDEPEGDTLMPRVLSFLRGLLLALAVAGAAATTLDAQAAPIAVVAAENFYGDIARQIGGDRVAVTSILSDPGVDPHEYESSMDDAKAVSSADLVIENGGGYDPWMDELLVAAPRDGRVVIRSWDVAPDRMPDNPHIWYGVDNAGAVADAITRSLSRALPQDAAFFARNSQEFHHSLVDIKRRFAQISARWAGAPVGLTETIFLYQTRPLGLRVITPPEFQKAVSEGNDPPADAVVEMENQIAQKKMRILIINKQTLSAVVARARDDAVAAHIPTVGITETMPAGETYQTWMLRQLDEVAAALGGAAP
jgi:zinc/manganese transport system substrate-binding protein